MSADTQVCAHCIRGQPRTLFFIAANDSAFMPGGNLVIPWLMISEMLPTFTSNSRHTRFATAATSSLRAGATEEHQ